MFLLRCPHCKNTMKYQARDGTALHKRKTCVYCGKGFTATKSIVKTVER
jgi:transcriptional regulator NrdR family protein